MIFVVVYHSVNSETLHQNAFDIESIVHIQILNMLTIFHSTPDIFIYILKIYGSHGTFIARTHSSFEDLKQYYMASNVYGHETAKSI